MNNIYKTCRFHKTFFPWALMGNYVIFTFFIIESIWEVHKAFQKRFGVYSLSLPMSVFLLSFIYMFMSTVHKRFTLIMIMLGKGSRILETQCLWRSSKLCQEENFAKTLLYENLSSYYTFDKIFKMFSLKSRPTYNSFNSMLYSFRQRWPTIFFYISRACEF